VLGGWSLAFSVQGLAFRPPMTSATTRRDVVIQSIGSLLTSGMSSAAVASDVSSPVDAFQTYQVVPDASEALNPYLDELKVRKR
jgi:hypothetical protein